MSITEILDMKLYMIHKMLDRLKPIMTKKLNINM